MSGPVPSGGMTLAEVLVVLDAVEKVGCRYWLEGGWGVDALLGYQSRPHRDLDVDIDGGYEDGVLEARATRGYVLETDCRPNRGERAAAGRGWVDVHPLELQVD